MTTAELRRRLTPYRRLRKPVGVEYWTLPPYVMFIR